MIELWDELNSIEEYSYIKFLDEKYIESEDEHNKFLTEMANVRGNYVKIEDIDFSFYISEKNSNHSIRLKICWNRNRLISEECGYMKLHGDYEYIQSNQLKYKPKQYEIDTARYFAKRYKVLFAAAWERKLDCDDIAEYFKGRLTWNELMSQWINLPDDIVSVLSKCKNLKDLEYAVRKNSAFNMND